MLLQKLREYSARVEDLPPPAYSLAWVRYEIHLDRDGNLLHPEPFDLADKQNKRGQRRAVPQVTRTVAVKPLLLADNAEYTLGLARETSKPERVAECHAAYLSLLDECAMATGDSAVQAVQMFLGGKWSSQLHLPTDFDRGSTIVFRVEGELPTDHSAVQEFWARKNLDRGEAASQLGQCLICGRRRPILKRLPGNIKGIPGGQTSGTALISANAEAFESYGLKNSEISPVCAECADLFTKAVNDLLREERSRYILGGLAFVFWTREAQAEFDWGGFLRAPDAADVRALLASVRKGGYTTPVDETEFYAISLSASGGRAVVRDWIDTTVGEAKQALARWFARQQIVDAYGEPGLPLGLYALAAATVRDPNNDLSPPTPRTLLRAALAETPLPFALLHQAVRRCQVERDVTRPRAALIKLVLLSQDPNQKEDFMVSLQAEHPDPAYHCGRLLATLEQVQRAALGNINATVVDRFYGTASTAPASIFGRLLRGAQPHLSRLRRDRPGTAHALQEELEEILSALEAFPRTLTLKEQALFALGYYHQRAHDRAQAKAAAEQRRAAKSSDAESADRVAA